MMPHSETDPQSMCASRLAVGRPNGDLVRRRKAMVARGKPGSPQVASAKANAEKNGTIS